MLELGRSLRLDLAPMHIPARSRRAARRIAAAGRVVVGNLFRRGAGRTGMLVA